MHIPYVVIVPAKRTLSGYNIDYIALLYVCGGSGGAMLSARRLLFIDRAKTLSLSKLTRRGGWSSLWFQSINAVKNWLASGTTCSRALAGQYGILTLPPGLAWPLALDLLPTGWSSSSGAVLRAGVEKTDMRRRAKTGFNANFSNTRTVVRYPLWVNLGQHTKVEHNPKLLRSPPPRGRVV